MKRKRGRAKGKLSANRKNDVIIAKVVDAFLIWGISSSHAYPIISKAAYEVLDRVSEYGEGGALSDKQIENIYLDYKKRKRKELSWRYSFELKGFVASEYTKVSRKNHIPNGSLMQIACDLMMFMNVYPMRCIYKPGESYKEIESDPIVSKFYEYYHPSIRAVLQRDSLVLVNSLQNQASIMPKNMNRPKLDMYGNIIPYYRDAKTHKQFMAIKSYAILKLIHILKNHISTLK